MANKKNKVGYKPSPLQAGQWGWGSKSKIDTSGLESRKKDFEKLGTKNLYADVKNPYADIETNFENVYEDLTINQKQFEAQQEMFRQSQATTLQKMQELGMVNVQALQNQAQRQSRQAAADIGAQESRLEQMRAQGAERVQAMEREAEMKIAQGEWTAEQARIQGAVDARSLEYQKIQGLMSLEAGEIASQRQSESANRNWVQRTFSDIRLKKNITLIGTSNSGLNVYTFEYKNPMYGNGVYQGVMSNEVPSYAISRNENGYDMVDYGQLDVDFIKL